MRRRWPDENRRSVVNLDETDIDKPLCRTLRRAPNPYFHPIDNPSPGEYLEQPVAGSWSVHAEQADPTNVHRKLVLQQCNTNTRQLVVRATSNWGLTRRAVYWVKGPFLNLRYLRTGTNTRYRFDTEETFLGDARVSVAATVTRLFVTEYRAGAPTYVVPVRTR
jgi:hypothetical protein